jgi:small subunit ribosomal protein S18
MPSSRKQRSRPRPTDSKSRIRRGRPKVCMLCKDRVTHVDYKDSSLLRRFMSERGKIKSRSSTGTCTQHQAAVALAIKNAREMALLPYVVRTLAGDKGGRGRRGGPGGGRPDRPDGPRPDGPRPDRAAPTAESAEDTDGAAVSAAESSPEADESNVEDGAAVGAVDAVIAEPVS